MLRVRVTTLKNAVLDLIKRSSKDATTEHERITYFISNADFIVNSFLQKVVVFEEDLISFEKELASHVDQHVELSSKEYFGSLVDFVRNFAHEENEKELRKLSVENDFDDLNNQHKVI